ncbi:hypothetical protein [Streptomyces sp. NPDC056255]|uniref:hypothetical protein n=1 Tax=Streptomyces sp. NPDC056255 TaxID=3345764 RepID=UPI0035DC7BD8
MSRSNRENQGSSTWNGQCGATIGTNSTQGCSGGAASHCPALRIAASSGSIRPSSGTRLR